LECSFGAVVLLSCCCYSSWKSLGKEECFCCWFGALKVLEAFWNVVILKQSFFIGYNLNCRDTVATFSSKFFLVSI
jgi:hypothetical protein